MRRTIEIGGKEIDMVANGMTLVLYRNLFRKDFLTETQKKDTDLTVFQEIGFVMAMQAEKPLAELAKGLTYEMYFGWLEQFEGAMDVIEKVDEIYAVFSATQSPTSQPKKKGKRPTGHTTQQSSS